MAEIQQFLGRLGIALLEPKRYPWLATPLVAFLIGMAIHGKWFTSSELLVQDFFMRERAEASEKIDQRLLYVGINDASIAALGRWPWEREIHAALFKVLGADPPGAIAYDIWFPEKSQDTDQDESLANEAAKLGAGVFAAVARKADLTGYNQSDFGFTFPIESLSGKAGDRVGAAEAILPYAELAGSGYVGFVDSKPDVDGKRRRLPLVVRVGEEFYPGLITQALMTYWGLEASQVEVEFGRHLTFKRPEGDHRVPIDQNGEMAISWRFQDRFRSVGFADLLAAFGRSMKHGEPVPEELSNLGDRILVVGQDSIALADIGPTPLEVDTPLSTTHLNALNTILTGDYVRTASNGAVMVIWIAVALGVGMFLSDRGAIWAALLPLGLTVVYLVFARQLFLSSQILLPVTWPVVSQILLHFGAGTVHWLKEQRQREQLKSIFSTLVSGSLLDHILENPDSVQLGGETRPVAVFFSDIRSFTTLSEGKAPDELVDLLNQYFGEMVDCIHQKEGTLHKYIGDAIMAVWGDILPSTEQHCARASVLAALDMRKRLRVLNLKLKAAGEMEFSIGMGVNFGEVLVGYIGAPERREFTVMGDAVNTASRLEGLTKEFQTDLAIGPRCRELLGDQFVTRLLGQIVVKGKNEPLRVFEVFGEVSEISDQRRQWASNFDRAMELYFGQRFQEAESIFENCVREAEGDYASTYYRKRCQELQHAPPPSDWQGHYVMTSK